MADRTRATDVRPPVALRPLRRRARRRRRRRPRRGGRPGADVADRPRHGRRRRGGARGGPRARAALLARRRAVERLGRVRGPARVRLRAAPRRSGAARHARRLPRRPRAPDLGDGRPAGGARLPARPLRAAGARGRRPAARAPAPRRRRARPPGQRRPAARPRGSTGKDTLFPPYLVPGAVAYVARSRPTVEEAIAVIHAAGGVAVWAHPFWDIADRDTVLAAIARFAAAGLDGVEVFYATHDEEQTRTLHAAVDRARAAGDGLGRLPRPAAREVQPLRRVRALRARAAARPDRAANRRPAASAAAR